MDAARATEIAREYLKYFDVFRPISGHKANGCWVIRVDIGLLKAKVLELEIDDETGEIQRGR